MVHRPTFNHLVESAQSLNQQPETSLTLEAVRVLLEFTRDHGPLHTEAAWRLSANIERKLETTAGFRPPGGWAPLTALLAGTDHLNATRDGFVLHRSPQLTNLDDTQIQLDLVEAMTRRLVPPATAASIFIALGIHPAWGLRMAWEVQNPGRGPAQASSPPMGELLPSRGLEPVRKAVFIFIAVVAGTIERLEPMKSYPIDAFGAVLEEAIKFARSVGECGAESEVGAGLPCFLKDSVSNRRVMQVLARDLLDDVFIPAGVIRDVGDARFAVVSELFVDVRVDEMNSDERVQWMEAFLEPDGDSTGVSEGRR